MKFNRALLAAAIAVGLAASLSACATKGQTVTFGTAASKVGAVNAIVTASVAKMNAVCVKADAAAPILVPIATVAAGIASPSGAAIVTDVDTLGAAACKAVEATYQGVQAAEATVTTAPAVAAPALPTPAPASIPAAS